MWAEVPNRAILSLYPAMPPPRDPRAVLNDLLLIFDGRGATRRLRSLLDAWAFWPPERLQSPEPWEKMGAVLHDEEVRSGRNEAALALFTARYDDESLSPYAGRLRSGGSD